MIIIKNNKALFSSILIFSILTIPFINTLPYLDGNIDFVQTLDFRSGGLNQYFANWNSVHPPFKLFLISPFYPLLGISPVSYSLPGILIGILGIISIFLLTKKLFGQKTANLAAIFFSVYPLIIANSIFAMRDLILTVFILTSLSFYIKKKYFFFAFFCSLAILTKESALLLPMAVATVEIIYKIKKGNFNIKKFILQILPLTIPFLIYYIWKLILDSSNKSSWNEWIFAENQNKGAVFTIINNLLTFDFINPYALQHWKQLFILNFNWVYLIIIFLGLFIYISRRRKLQIFKNGENLKVILIIFVFSISYFLTVLSLQTYTIPRYALPLIPFLIIALAKSITSFKNYFIKGAIVTLVLILLFLSNFFSIDVVATNLWGKIKIFNQEIYGLNDRLAGNDGITYNAQYLLIAKTRSDMIINASKENRRITNSNCRWIFPDPNNERKMFRILNLKTNLKCNYPY